MKRNKYILNAFITVSGEMIKEHGEDSFSYDYSEKTGFIGVFDGCGGTGGKRYQCYGSYTGAYLASRAAALSTLECWNRSKQLELSPESLKMVVKEKLAILKENDTDSKEQTMLLGSLNKKDFPTTASLMTFDFTNSPVCKYMWAGDSRGYILDKFGLCQITKDDVDADVDAFSNIQSDARVSNVINADVDFYINCKTIYPNEPAIFFVATDGCFSYYETPMEFEHLIISTLCDSKSLYEWEKKLDHHLKKQASDDYTISIVLGGFKSFKETKEYFKKRLAHLKKEYIDLIMISRKNGEELDLEMLWNKYKDMYYRYE